ncbi:aldo/keto reductase [Eubacteriales bacterium OttesenSCG-928-K08]|nr:aldo/keto reductase [Eubacteriales bacterium OttesenSCG-928-K08]
MQQRMYGSLGYPVSLLGMGCMRLPRVFDGKGGASVDVEQAVELIRYAAQNGVNYFDTAFTYHGGQSEQVLGEALVGLRENVRVVTKQPIAVMKTNSDIRRNLESTLKKLRTDYLDVYLVHNIMASSWQQIKDRRIYDEFVKLKEEGLIRSIGFSYHGAFPTFENVINEYPWDMCQVQQNIMDVDKETTDAAIRLAGEKKMALVIMEPLRGGGLVNPPPAVQAVYDEAQTKRTALEWAFRHLVDYPQVSCILSGMTTLEQLKQNIALFSKEDMLANNLNPSEREMIKKVKATYEQINSIPCTGCEYCLPCPNGVAIPDIFKRYNESVMFDYFDQPGRAYMLIKRGNADATQCVECGACEKQCPQRIAIMEQLKKAHEKLDGWLE